MPHKVSLSRLKLSDFRNYAGLSLDLDTRHVVLTGENGAGKDQSDGGRFLPLAGAWPAPCCLCRCGAGRC